jgi:hypothetical protein
MQYDYLDVASGFVALQSKYLWFFSSRGGSHYVVGDITRRCRLVSSLTDSSVKLKLSCDVSIVMKLHSHTATQRGPSALV